MLFGTRDGRWPTDFEDFHRAADPESLAAPEPLDVPAVGEQVFAPPLPARERSVRRLEGDDGLAADHRERPSVVADHLKTDLLERFGHGVAYRGRRHRQHSMASACTAAVSDREFHCHGSLMPGETQNDPGAPTFQRFDLNFMKREDWLVEATPAFVQSWGRRARSSEQPNRPCYRLAALAVDAHVICRAARRSLLPHSLRSLRADCAWRES
jgi:hypothetical protein